MEEVKEEINLDEAPLEPEPCQPPNDDELRESVLLLCNLVKVAEMNTFTDVNHDEIVKCVMLYKSFSMRTREEMCDELLKVCSKSEDLAIPQNKVTYADMHSILHKISQADMNPP